MSQLWRTLDLPIRTIGRTIQVWLEPTRQGQLRLSARKRDFPEGELSMVVSNWPQTSHWIVPARLDGEVLWADLSGSQAAFDPSDDRPLILSLVRHGEGGLIRYPLRAARLKNKLSERQRCLFCYDERDWFAEPVDCFTLPDGVREAVPGFALNNTDEVVLALHLWRRPLRYWQQLRYTLTRFDVDGDMLRCAADAPKYAPELVGFTLCTMDGRVMPCCPTDGDGVAALPLFMLPRAPGEWFLAGVCEQEDGDSFCVPLSVNDPGLHREMEEQCSRGPLLPGDALSCWLTLDDLCTPSFTALSHRPYGQDPVPGRTLEEALQSQELPILGHCCVRDRNGSDWTLRLELSAQALPPDTPAFLLANYRTTDLVLPVSVNPAPGGTLLTADLTPLRDCIQNGRMARWGLSLAYDLDGAWYHLLMRCPERMVRRNYDTDPEYLDYTRGYSQPIGEVLLEDYAVCAQLCCVKLGYCCIQSQDAARLYDYQMVTRVDLAELNGKDLTLRLRCPHLVQGTWVGVMLDHRYKLDADRASFFLPAQHVTDEQGLSRMEVEADLSQITFTPLYWDIRAVFQTPDGQRYLVRATDRRKRKQKRPNRLQRLRNKLDHLLHTDSYRQDRTWTVSLYRTSNFGYALVCQEHSPYSGLAFRLKERLAMQIYRLFRKRLARKSIYLCYEKYCCMAQDNGFYFFRHCMEQDMERKMGRSIYYVIDKKQPDYRERLLPYKDHVIQFMSLRHMVYLLAARLLISSDSKAHAYAWRAKESIILPRIEQQKKLVFLQHGVIALKRVQFYSKGTNAVQLFVTSNQREHDIICKEMDYPDEDVIITGLARWDVLEDAGWPEKHILIMPTWRNWLEEVSDAAFQTSDYYRNYMALLNDEGMGALLERYDLYLDFYIHPKFRDYISNFSIGNSGRVRLIPFGAEPLNQLIMGCKLLITDYSSVCWDVYYQGKPVLFYQFDVEQYNESTGSYIDLETELFGDRALTPEALLSLLEQYAKDGFALPRRYAEMRPHMFAYLDHNNSQRTCEEIMKRHW